MGQTAPRLPYSPGLSTCDVGVEVDIFLETGASGMGSPRIFLTTFWAGSGICTSARS